MLNIYDIEGRVILQVPVTPQCERVESLMQSDYVQLSWSSEVRMMIPVGSYIVYEQERFALLDNYLPEQVTEREWKYTPHFESYIMAWSKVPFFMYTPDGAAIRREIDWSLTGEARLFMERICLGLEFETGVEFEYSTTMEGSASLTFNSADILSALNAVADAFETEWWVDKSTRTIHLGKCEIGENKTLSVGENIGVPKVTNNTEGYYNRFYVFGSTRNIVQSYNGANTNNLVNKRLTLDPAKYPDGYYEPDGKKDTVFSKILVFDDIYPSATKFEVYDLLSREEYVTDSETGDKKQIGTDKDGNPIYDTFSIWYFKIGRKTDDGYEQFFLNDWNYSEDPQKQGEAQPGLQGMLIPGLAVSVNFQTGSLRGREFELHYHNSGKTVGDLSITKGYFEILYTQEGDYIIPDSNSLKPREGDNAILFNIKMPDSYITDAYERLEESMLKEIDEKYNSDLNQYEFDSDPTSFKANDPRLKIGSKVLFKNLGHEQESRVISLTKSLDYDFCQRITIGKTAIKGITRELRENIASANKSIEVLYKKTDNTKSLANRSFRQSAEMMDMVIKAFSSEFAEAINPVVVKTMGMLVGSENLQFKVFNSAFQNNIPFPISYAEGVATVGACGIRHYTLGVTDYDISTPSSRDEEKYLSWRIEEQAIELENANRPYYIYAKVATTKLGESSIVASLDPIGLRDEGGYYHLLAGVISSEVDGSRSFAPLYGYTEILPNQILTGAIRSEDGDTVFDLEKGILSLEDRSGISGSDEEGKDDGLSIAAWFGGKRIDLEHLLQGQTEKDAAASLFRFNGTGYFAQGNITWDENGDGQLGGRGNDFALKWKNGKVYLGNNVRIDDDGSTVENAIVNDGKTSAIKRIVVVQGEVTNPDPNTLYIHT